jgi:hypothetical protein
VLCSVWGTDWVLKYYSDGRRLQGVNQLHTRLKVTVVLYYGIQTWRRLNCYCTDTELLRFDVARFALNLTDLRPMPHVQECCLLQAWFVFWRSRVQTLAQRPAIPTEVLRDFPQSLQAAVGLVIFNRSTTVSFHILFNSPFTCHPFIWHCMLWVNGTAPLNYQECLGNTAYISLAFFGHRVW